jgi:hypothetical protein
LSQTQLPPSKQSVRRRSLNAPLPPRPEDRGRFWLATGLWTLALLALAVFFYRNVYTGSLTNPDAMDFAQIARNMVNGHGYATAILRPLAVSGFAGPDASGVAPDVSRAPLYPLILMFAFMGHGKHGGDSLVIALSLALFFLSVYGVYRLSRTFFPAPEQIWIAVLSMGLYGVGSGAMGYAFAGGPVSLATLLVTVLMIALYRAAETPTRPATFGGALWVGGLLGFCYLAQYSLLLLALPVLVYVFFSRPPVRAWAGIGACVLGFLIITGPWLIRNARLCHGDPFFTLLFYGIMANTSDYPGQSTIYRSVVPSVGPLVYFYQHLPDMPVRLGQGLTIYRDGLLQAFNFFLLAAAAASLLWRAPDVRQNAVRACAAIGILVIVVVTSLFQPTVQMIAPFAPLITVAAVGFVFSTVTAQGWDIVSQRIALWGMGLLVGLGAFVQDVGLKPINDSIAQGMNSLSDQTLNPIDNDGRTPPDAVISDSPWDIAWRLSVPSVWLPADNNAYQNVAAAAARSQVNIRAMLLTPHMADYDIADGEATSWVLLSTHPTADQDHLKADQYWDNFASLVARKDPRVRALIAKYPPDVLQNYLANNKAQVDANYQTQYGQISDIIADFNDPLASVTESNSYKSTVFLRGGGTPSGQ